MTITTTTQQAASLLSPADVLDISRAVVRTAYYGLQPDMQDRQALATATYLDAWPSIYRRLCERILDGSIRLPLSGQIAKRFLDLTTQLPDVSTASIAERVELRPGLADVPHSITVELITPELRRDSDLPDAAALVVVERHAGRLSKVCDVTDITAAWYAQNGQHVTIDDLAHGIAKTYGATYVEDPAVAL